MKYKFDKAQICLNGCVINSRSSEAPELNASYCIHCGAQIIDKCPNCQEPIRGMTSFYNEAFNYWNTCGFNFPRHCHGCGSPYPWTEKALQAATILIQEADELTPEEKAAFKENINELTADTPMTPVATHRIKKVLSKLGQGTADAIGKIIITVVTEATKQALFPK